MDINISGKINSKTFKRKKYIEELQTNIVPNNNLNDDVIHEISDDSEDEEELNNMAKNKRKGDKIYINCYSKIIERLKFKTPEEISSKKLKINETLNDIKENSITKSDEIIGIESISSYKISDNDINGIIKTSSYSSSELIDSSQSLSLNKVPIKVGIQSRPMLKNTIPSDYFQKFLDSLEKKYKKVSTDDKVVSWEYSSDVSEVEDVIEFEERRKLLRLLYRENYNRNKASKLSSLISSNDINLPIKKLLRSSKIKNCNNNNCNIVNSLSNSKNLKDNQLLKNEQILKIMNTSKISPSSTNSGWSTDYSKDDKSLTTLINNNVNENIITPTVTIKPIKNSSTNKLIQIRKDYGSKLSKEEIFKIPNVPRKYLPSSNNKTEISDQKEEFYKYLGLGTKSSENDNYNSSTTNAAAAAELKRRSLRVRRLQLYQQNNIKKITDNKEKYKSFMNNEVSVKANGQLRLHQSDDLDSQIPSSKETPKIQIICSVNSNANTKHIKKLEKSIPVNNEKVQNKSIISAKTTSQSQLQQIPIKTTKKSSNNSDTNIKNKKQLNSKSITTLSTGELTDEDKSSVTHLSEKDLQSEGENSDSLIIVKRSYQQTPIPNILNKYQNNFTKRINPIIIPNDNSHLKNDYLKNKSNKNSVLLQNKNNIKDKIKIEFSTDYRTKINNNNNISIGIEKTTQTLKTNISTLQESKDIETNIMDYRTRSCTPQNIITDKTNNQELKKNLISNIIDNNKTQSNTPSECKVVIEKLTDKQINNESVIKENIKENIIKKNYDKNNVIIKSKKNRKIWTKSKKLNLRRSNLNQSRILRNKKIIKIIKKPINISDKLKKIRKERKNSEKSINLHGPAKIAKMIVKTTTNNNNIVNDKIYEKHLISLENIENNNIETTIEKRTPKKTENNINKNNIIDEIKSYKKINELDVITQNLLPNPLKFENGDVLHAYYECEFLIIIQEFSISFWKYSKVIQMLGEAQEWELLGECKRKLIDEEIFSPYKNRICINDSNPVYIELRARQLPNDNRECNLASPYINIYYFDVWKNLVTQQSIQLDTIKCLSKFISYTTIINSRYFIMCWKQDTILGTNRTGLCKYALTPDLETLASIRDFKNLRHIVFSLQCCDDDKLIGFGESQITIWDHRTGDVLTNFDLGIPIGKNLGSLISSIEFENYLFIYQLFHNEDTDDLPELKIIAITISLNTPSFRLVYNHELPLQFIAIKSSLNTNDYCIITAVTGEEIWIMPHHPQRLLYMNEDIATSSKRFYSTGSFNFIEITGDYLNVKKIHENLLNIVTT